MAVESIVTIPFRLAFPEVFEAKAAVQGGREKFSITMLFPKDGSKLLPGLEGGADMMQLRKLLFDATMDKWGTDKTKWPQSIRAMDFKTCVSTTGKDGWPIRDGDSVEWDGFPGQFFMKAGSQFQPGIVNARKQEIIDKSAVFGGLICRAQINAFAYDSAGNKGVSFGLQNLQILKDDGTIFGGRQNPAAVFDEFGPADSPEAAAAAEEPW